MKKVISLILVMIMVLAMVSGCASKTATSAASASASASAPAASASASAPAASASASSSAAASTSASSEGKVFNIYAWNEEFKGFFEKYYKVPDGVTVNWIIVPSDNGAYQDALDAALLGQADAADDDKVDLFLAEADYILKYVNADATQDVKALGVTDFSNTYDYTVQAATDTNGTTKGVSFQCCPSALIYRRSIAKDVLGTDDPAEVQAKLDSWDKFNSVAADAKAKGYYMFILLAILPVLVVYIFLSKSIIKGVTAGGVKG